MARWVMFGELELGRHEAGDREGAERLGRRIYGDRLIRVQSVVSLEAAAAERRDPRRDPWEEDR